MKTRAEVLAEKSKKDVSSQPDTEKKEKRREYNGLKCPECGHLQFTTPSGVVCANGHGGLEGVKDASEEEPKAKSKKESVEEISKQIIQQLDPKESPFQFPSPHAAKANKLRPDLAKIVETIRVVDMNATWLRMQKALKIGEKSSEHGVLHQAIDNDPTLAYDAHRLYVTAKLEYKRWELANDVVHSAMWSAASQSLQKEKDDGLRAKAITDADVKARCMTLFPDEWIAQELGRAQIKETVDNLEFLVKEVAILATTHTAMLQKLRG